MTTFWAVFNLLVMAAQGYLMAYAGYHLITWTPIMVAVYLLLAAWVGRARYCEEEP